jgi:4-diphosphocytidyl-2-C-methyl-D-erythritol kinase
MPNLEWPLQSAVAHNFSQVIHNLFTASDQPVKLIDEHQSRGFRFGDLGFFSTLQPMTIERGSPCKVNLVLNILARRSDGFHELETVMHPVAYYDHLTFRRNGTVGSGSRIALTCSDSSLSTDKTNLVYRAAEAFLNLAEIKDAVAIHLEKRIPVSAGLGGGSGNAATTLLGLNELFGFPLGPDKLDHLASSLGSDIPFFLQNGPALATGRGEQVKSLHPFPALQGAALLLIHPGFGIATAWAYQQLARFPKALNGRRGRAEQLLNALNGPAADLSRTCKLLYNSLEAPALEKFPLLQLFQDFLRSNGALGTLMSGSGSTTFAIVRNQPAAEQIAEKFRGKFGDRNWMAVVRV